MCKESRGIHLWAKWSWGWERDRQTWTDKQIGETLWPQGKQSGKVVALVLDTVHPTFSSRKVNQAPKIEWAFRYLLHRSYQRMASVSQRKRKKQQRGLYHSKLRNKALFLFRLHWKRASDPGEILYLDTPPLVLTFFILRPSNILLKFLRLTRTFCFYEFYLLFFAVFRIKT